MKYINFKGLLLVLSIFIVACGGDKKQGIDSGSDVNEQQEPDYKDCTYSVNTFKSTVHWTAFKTTDLIAVNGIFENVAIQSTPNVKSPELLIEGTKFEINPFSVFSNNADRDKLLVDKFFKVVVPEMYGEFKGIEGNAKEGKGNIEMRWNGLKRNVEYSYEIDLDTMYIKTDINLIDWEAEKALQSINDACKLMHTGADGKSLTSDNVKAMVKVVLAKKCY